MADARFVLIALCAFLPCGTTTGADDVAAKRPRHHLAHKFGQEGYPHFDIRFDERGLPTPTVTAALAAAAGGRFAEAWERDLSRLQERVPNLEYNRHQVLGVASWLGSSSGYLTAMPADPLAAPTPEQAAKAFLAEYPGLFGDLADEISSAPLYGNYVTDHNGVQHLAWQQRIAGLDLVGCEVRSSIAPDGRVIGLACSMAPEPEGGFVIPEAMIDARAALEIAVRDVGQSFTAEPEPRVLGGEEGTDPAEKTEWTGLGLIRQDVPVTTKRVLFLRAAGDIRPAFWAVIPTDGIGHVYDTIVDATDGAVLSRTNRLVFETTQPVTYRVFPDDSPAPGSPGALTNNAFQFPFVTPQVVTVQPDAIRAFSPNGWIPDGQSTTVGNNTATHSDTNADNAPDLPRPDGGAARDFSALTFNSALSPADYRNFSVVSMFYWTNYFHDVLYSLGFNEAAGNFQTQNFSGQGVGNDAVQCDAQDGSGTNNANWQGTGVDGEPNRVQMYIFPANQAIVDRDGTLDNDILFHEHGHGLSTRLHRGLTGLQPRSMGEGWSDFVGIVLNARPGDDPEANYCVGGYATYGFPSGAFFDNYYFGIRRFPYSTNMEVNPQTFADADEGQQSYPANIPRSPIIGNSATSVHNMGEIWCNTLMEGRAAMMRAYGFPGNMAMLQLVVDGMKLVNTSTPTMLNERTAILQADLANNGGANQLLLWRAFARRGMGSSAVSTNSNSTVGIVESFEVPQRVNFTYPDPLPTQLYPNAPVELTVNVEPLNLTLVADSGRLHYSVDGGPFQIIPMTADGPSRYNVTLPGFGCLEGVRYYFDVDTSAGRLSNPDSGAAMAYAARVFTGYDIAFEDTGESDGGWTVATTATAGAWQRGVPVNLNRGDPAVDSADPGPRCWVTQNGPFDSDVDNGTTALISRSFEALEGDSISYEFWLNTTSSSSIGAGDGFFVEYATDAAGTNWVPVRSFNTPSNTWRTDRLTVGNQVPASATLRLRFIAADVSPGNIVEAGFDNLSVSRLACRPCAADFNNDGSVEGSDVEAFFIAWTQGLATADVDQSGGVDGSDVEAFFTVWEAGGC